MKKKHWYFISIEACVLCGYERIYRERRYTRRPKRWMGRHEYSEFACYDHF